MRLAAFAQSWLLATTGIILLAAPVCAADGWHTDFEAARKQAQATGKPLLVHFWADWCAPCKKMDSSVFNQTRVIKALSSDVIAVKINADQHKDLSIRFGVETLPADICLATNGDRIVESNGFRDASEYIEFLKRAKTRQNELARKGMLDSEAPVAANTTPSAATEATPQVAAMIDGYCPVTLWNNRKWVKGSSEFKGEFRGQTFHFASAEALDSFNKDPRRYTPRFLGCDPVIVWESDRAVRGTTKFAAFYDDELYLFINGDNRDRFKTTPDNFIRTRIVLRPDEIESVIR